MNARVRLHRIEAEPVTLHFSPGYGERARDLGILVSEAHRFFESWMGVKAHTTLSVLRHENWRYLRRAPYGYLHSSPEQSTIFIPARYPQRLLERTRALYESAPPDLQNRLCDDPSDLTSQIEMLYRLVAVHELGHLFIHHLQLALGTRWLTELVANYFATAYFVQERPDYAACWFAWAEIQAHQNVPYQQLAEYEVHFDTLDFANASFYQGRFNQEALRLWDTYGRTLIPSLLAHFSLRPESVLGRFTLAAPTFHWHIPRP